MAVIKCKMCGGSLNITEDSSVYECEYCGTKQTVPKADDEKKLKLFDRAGKLLRACEFDKAAGVFEAIVSDFPEEAEAYWGLVLCKYGIEYVDDPATGKKIPTCHRSSFESVEDDPNFEQACENADALARRVYREEARQIEGLRKKILEVSGKEEPYDVFISYKETDEAGERTPDSVIAQDIYKALTNEGYRVFFSRISLEGKLGVEYEPYIFAALNSARVLLAVGTDYEYFDAVWVKNEWSRFLKLIASGQPKTLIPVYKDMDPYDMPKELRGLAAQNMGKLGAMQDLLHGIEKIVGKKGAEAAQPQQVIQQVIQGGGPNAQALLKRGFLALEEKEWNKAREFFDQVLNMDAENYDAYLGLTLAENERSSRAAFEEAYIDGRIFKSASLRRARRYAAGDQKAWWASLDMRLQSVNERKAEQKRRAEEARRRAEEDRIRAEEERKQQEKQLIVRSLREKMEGHSKAGLEQQLTIAKEKRDKIAAALADFDGLQAQLFQKNAVEEALLRQREALRQNRNSLGLFAGKKKTQLDAELARLDRQIEYTRAGREELQRRLCGLTSIEQARKAKAILDSTVEEKEKQLAAADNATYSFPYVVKILNRDIQTAEAIYQMNRGLFIRFKAKMSRGCLAASGGHTVGLKADGTVTAVGEYFEYKLQKAGWTDVTLVASGDQHIVGLKEDGTVMAVGRNDAHQCEVSNWRDIIDIAAGSEHTVGLRADGTVVAVGSNSCGQCKVSGWKNIAAVEACHCCTIGLRADGTVVAVGDNESGQCEVADWREITAVSAGGQHTVGLKADGTAVAVGWNDFDQCEVSDWKDIVAVAAGYEHTVGLKADGTVAVVGDDYYDQDAVSDWKNIVAVAAGEVHTVGLKADGTVVAVGENEDGQCDVSDWRGIGPLETE